MYFKFSSLFIDFKKKGRKLAAFFKFINLGGLHSHTYRIESNLLKNFTASSLQTSLQNQTKREGYEKDDYNNLIISLLVRTVANSSFRLAKEI